MDQRPRYKSTKCETAGIKQWKQWKPQAQAKNKTPNKIPNNTENSKNQ